MNEDDPPLQSELEEIVDDLEEKAMGHAVQQSRDEDNDDAEPVAERDEQTQAGTTGEPTD